MGVYDNYQRVREEVAAACAAAGRSEDSVTLVVISKTFPPSAINEAISAGATDIGENYVQEFLKKREEIDSSATLHFTGHLQSNKAKSIVGKVALIQSVDRLSLAQEIDRQAQKQGLMQRVLLEVNMGEESSKSGASFDQVEELAYGIAALPGLELCGFMSIPPHAESAGDSVPYFERLYHLFLDMKQKKIDNTNICILSMGMSSDFKEAIACGATMVRVGTAIFGSRQY